jgi:hypothetical protein
VIRRLRGRVQATGAGFVVGSQVSLACDIQGVIVDLLIDRDSNRIEGAVIAFDTGPGEPTLYQPISLNMLRRVADGFAVAVAIDGDLDGLAAALHAAPMPYVGNMCRPARPAMATPQSRWTH